MPIGFGFGVGDFIATLNLFKDVADALKDHGGAADDFQKTLRQLESTRAILTCLEQFDNPTSRSASLNAIRISAQHIKCEVDEFLAKIKKYKARIRSPSAGKSFASVASKIKWSQYVAGQVTQLYGDIDRETNRLQLLLNYHNLNAVEIIQHGQQSITQQLRSDAKDRIQLQGDIEVLHQRSHALSQRELRKGFSELSSHINNFEARVSARDATRHDQIATKDDINDLKQHLAVQSQLLIDACAKRDVPSNTSRATYILTVPTMNMPTEEMISRLRRFSEEVRVAIQLFFTLMPVGFRKMILAIPHLMLLCQLLLQRLPQAISLVLHDNITFEDALGRLQSLQFQQFRHWALFETSIRCNFEGLPGIKQVMSGQFVLTSPSHNEQLTAHNWSRCVRPGLVVKMGIIIGFQSSDSRCPHGCDSSTTKISDDEYRCYDCGISFSLQKRLEFTAQPRYSKMNAQALSGSASSRGTFRSSKSQTSKLQKIYRLSTRRALARLTPPSSASLKSGSNEISDREMGPEKSKQQQDPASQTEIEDIKLFKRVHMFRNELVKKEFHFPELFRRMGMSHAEIIEPSPSSFTSKLSVQADIGYAKTISFFRWYDFEDHIREMHSRGYDARKILEILSSHNDFHPNLEQLKIQMSKWGLIPRMSFLPPRYDGHFWIPKDLIQFEVITYEIMRYFGPNVFVRNCKNNEGVPGYLVSAPQAPTKEMLLSIQEASENYLLEKESAASRPVSYYLSRTRENRDDNLGLGRSQEDMGRHLSFPIPQALPPSPDAGNAAPGTPSIKSHENIIDRADEHIIDFANAKHPYTLKVKHPAKFQCDQCPEKFTHAYFLHSHLRTHTDKFHFICKFCGKGFARPRDQRHHEGLHVRPKGDDIPTTKIHTSTTLDLESSEKAQPEPRIVHAPVSSRRLFEYQSQIDLAWQHATELLEEEI